LSELPDVLAQGLLIQYREPVQMPGAGEVIFMQAIFREQSSVERNLVPAMTGDIVKLFRLVLLYLCRCPVP